MRMGYTSTTGFVKPRQIDHASTVHSQPHMASTVPEAKIANKNDFGILPDTLLRATCALSRTEWLIPLIARHYTE
jgi:hypothetical protein